MSSISSMIEKFKFIKRAYHLMFVKQIKLEKTEITRESSYEKLKNLVGKSIKAEKFKSIKSDFQDNNISKIDFWNFRNLNINRSVITIEFNKAMKLDELIKYVQDIKTRLGKATGYVPFFNEVGMQIVVYSDKILDSQHELKPVDTVSNQRTLIQSIFIIDTKNRKYYKAFSVMQTITSKIQTIIDKTITEEVCD